MSTIFETAKLKNLTLRNRLIMSATCCPGGDPNGYPTEKQIAYHVNVARGGVGLITIGVVSVDSSGLMMPAQPSIADDSYIPYYKKFVEAVHKEGAKIAVQLSHGGREAANYLSSQGKAARAPSYISDDPYFMHWHGASTYQALNEDEIWTIIHAFGDAAKRAKESGFDAIQLHGAHAYLFSQFLSPYTNRRTDQWGGSLENRLRFHHEVYKNIREKVGEDYPIYIKFGVEDSFPNGLQFLEGKQAAILLAKWGIDAIEVSSGLRGDDFIQTEWQPAINSIKKEAYYRTWCHSIKKEINIPTIMTGGLRSYELIDEILKNEETDFIGLCRPLIREPNIVNRWKSGDHSKATCISCNQCLTEILRKGEFLECYLDRDL